MSRSTPVIGVALDAAGRGATARELVELAHTAERGNVDFVSLGDTLDPDTTKERVHLDALLALAHVAAATTTIGLLAHRHRHPHRAVPRVEEHRHARPRLRRARRLAGRRVDDAEAAARFGRRPARRPPSCTPRPTTSSRSSAGCGTAGRTTPSSATGRPAATSTATKVHYVDFEGRVLQRPRPVDHAPPAAGPADRRRPRRRRRLDAVRRPTGRPRVRRRPTSTPPRSRASDHPDARRPPHGRDAGELHDPGDREHRRTRATPRRSATTLAELVRGRRRRRVPAAAGPRCHRASTGSSTRCCLASPRSRPAVDDVAGHDAPRPVRARPPGESVRRGSEAPHERDERPLKQIHLAAHFPGVNNTTVWSDPTSGSQTDFASFVHLAQTAERGKFDFFFLAEGLRLREHRGQIFDLDVVGRPDSLTVLAALAAVTDRIGLAATLNTTFNEPYELARQFATLDHLSDGRAAWNAVTSPDAFTGENFRRGGFLDRDDRYDRAAEFITPGCGTLGDDAVVADAERRVAPDACRSHTGPEFTISGTFDVPRSPQGHPVLIQAGDSDGGRELAAQHADVIFSRHSGFRDGQAFYADVKRRLARVRPAPRRAQDHPGRDRRGRRHRGRRRGAGRAHPAASRSARRARSRSSSRSGAATCPATTPTARCPTSTPTSRAPTRSPGAGCATRRTRRPSPRRWRRARRGEGAEHPRAGHRGDDPLGVRRHAGRPSPTTINELRPGRRRRRLHPRAPPHAARARRFVDEVVPAAPGTRRVPDRLRRADAARPPRPGPPAMTVPT